MKNFYTIAVLLICLSLSGCAAGYAVKRTNIFKTETSQRLYSEDIKIQNTTGRLPLGEVLTYKVRWLGIEAGRIVASVAPRLQEINGQRAYKVEVIVKTSPFVSLIYKINDRFTSFIDVDTMLTLRHEVSRQEGRYKKDAVTDFDQQQHIGYFENFLDKTKKTFKIPENAQDTLSACYYFRIIKLKLNDKIEYFVVNNEQNYELFGAVEDKEFINIRGMGDFESFFMQPYAKIIGGEEVKKGKVSGYFSCDEKRLPLLAIVEAPMFTKVTAVLSKIEYVK